ncbi:MAG: GFA family protein [Gammaproteobacteria bacterium]
MSEPKLSGHCYCGAVKFEIDGKSDWVGHCHCESCRRQSGSVMTTFAGFKLDQVKFTAAMPNRFITADGVTRSFCGQCGSPISYEYTGRPDEIHMQLGLFDDLEPLAPDDHSFLQEKPSWLHADEHLPESKWVAEKQD